MFKFDAHDVGTALLGGFVGVLVAGGLRWGLAGALKARDLYSTWIKKEVESDIHFARRMADNTQRLITFIGILLFCVIFFIGISSFIGFILYLSSGKTRVLIVTAYTGATILTAAGLMGLRILLRVQSLHRLDASRAKDELP